MSLRDSSPTPSLFKTILDIEGDRLFEITFKELPADSPTEYLLKLRMGRLRLVSEVVYVHGSKGDCMHAI